MTVHTDPAGTNRIGTQPLDSKAGALRMRIPDEDLAPRKAATRIVTPPKPAPKPTPPAAPTPARATPKTWVAAATRRTCGTQPW